MCSDEVKLSVKDRYLLCELIHNHSIQFTVYPLFPDYPNSYGGNIIIMINTPQTHIIFIYQHCDTVVHLSSVSIAMNIVTLDKPLVS